MFASARRSKQVYISVGFFGDFKSVFLKILDCVLNGHQLIAVTPIIKTEHLSQIFYKDTVNRTKMNIVSNSESNR